MKGWISSLKRASSPSLPSRRAFWIEQNKKITKTCALVVVPMLTITVAMICIVFTTKVDPAGCPNPVLCTNASETVQVCLRFGAIYGLETYLAVCAVYARGHFHDDTCWTADLRLLSFSNACRSIGSRSDDLVQPRHGCPNAADLDITRRREIAHGCSFH
jgi:hypothetical protein